MFLFLREKCLKNIKICALRCFGHCFSFVACTHLAIFKLEFVGLYLGVLSWLFIYGFAFWNNVNIYIFHRVQKVKIYKFNRIPWINSFEFIWRSVSNSYGKLYWIHMVHCIKFVWYSNETFHSSHSDFKGHVNSIHDFRTRKNAFDKSKTCIQKQSSSTVDKAHNKHHI